MEMPGQLSDELQGTQRMTENFHVYRVSGSPARLLPCLHRLEKAFDRVWHAALWAIMKKYNVSTNLIQVIRNLYDKPQGH